MIYRAISLVLAAVVITTGAAASDDDDHHVSSLNGVRVIHAWTPATSDRTALVFADIENQSDVDVVVEGATSERADAVALVGFSLKDGEPVYVPLPRVPVKAGRELVLAPNGLAFRLTGLQSGLVEGSEFEMEIEFDFGHLDVHVEVEAADATQHSHAGHNH